MLRAGAREYKTLIAAMNLARTNHYFHTLEWAPGVRLLPVTNSTAYHAAVREDTVRYVDAKAAFVAAWPGLVDAARKPADEGGLGDLFNAADYPHPDHIADEFDIYYGRDMVPMSGDFRVEGLRQDEIDAIRAEVDERIEDATAEAMAGARERLGDVVRNMAAALGDPKKTFHDTLVGNARDLCDVLKRLNVTGDPELEAMRARVERELTQTTTEDIRSDPAKRRTVADRAAKIGADMGSFYGAAS